MSLIRGVASLLFRVAVNVYTLPAQIRELYYQRVFNREQEKSR